MCDEQIVSLLAVDVDRYYELVILQYTHRLYAYILFKVRNKEDAHDIVQEVFLHALVNLRKYSAPRIQALKLRQWLYSIATNVYYSYVCRYMPPPFVSLDASEEEDQIFEIEDTQNDLPDAIVVRAETQRELEVLIRTLPDSSREIIRSRYFQDLSYQEIADRLKQPATTVRVKAHRAISSLRKTAIQWQLERC
jgi:RNA polymerase sigma-70 factor (ECF subfamily)